MKSLIVPIRSALARRLILGLVLFSMLATLLVTSIQLYGEHRNLRRQVDAELAVIGTAPLAALAASVWATNQSEVALQLQSMVAHPFIEHVAVREAGVLTAQAGQARSQRTLERVYPIVYSSAGKTREIGTLTIVAGLDPVTDRLQESALAFLGGNALIIFLAAGFVFWLFHHLVTRHLTACADHVRTLNPTVAAPLTLARAAADDELEQLVTAINQLQATTRAAMDALRTSELRARAIADYTYDWESWHRPDRSLRWVSPAVERISGYSADECMVMSNYPMPLIDAADKAVAAEIFYHFAERRSSGNDQSLRIVRKDGTPIWCSVSWQPIYGDAGEYLGIRSSMRDITECVADDEMRVELERQLLQSQKMDAIGQLTGGIAHDFNNMLGAMLGYAEISREMLTRPGGAEKVGQYQDEILAAGNRAKELIAQMLTFSRTGRTQPGGVQPLIRMQPVVKEVVNMLRSSLHATIDVAYHIDDDTLQARIQPVHLHQIILNLGINARDAIGEYGHIEISLARHAGSGNCTSCRKDYAGPHIVLTVTDSGHGMDEHQVDKIFDPFFTTKEVGKGTGMGLSVVHGLVHGAGGHIDVASEAGVGTTIRILLPAAVAEAEVGAGDTGTTSQPSGYAMPGVLAGVRILVVDDARAMGALMQDLLSLRGAIVTTFSRPVAALAEYLRDPHAFDLVITDAAMPDLSGMDMARTMLRIRADLPIILCTGYSEHANPATAKAAGIAAFMIKPVDIARLVETAARLTRTTEAATP